MRGAVFDTVWASVATDFGGDPDEIETVRMRLAAIILDLPAWAPSNRTHGRPFDPTVAHNINIGPIQP
jgi:hypothetical protein